MKHALLFTLIFFVVGCDCSSQQSQIEVIDVAEPIVQPVISSQPTTREEVEPPVQEDIPKKELVSYAVGNFTLKKISDTELFIRVNLSTIKASHLEDMFLHIYTNRFRSKFESVLVDARQVRNLGGWRSSIDDFYMNRLSEQGLRRIVVRASSHELRSFIGNHSNDLPFAVTLE